MPQEMAQFDPNKPVCNVFFVPVPYAVQTIAGGQPQPAGAVMFTNCMGKPCSLWDKENNQCSNLTANMAQKKLADIKEAEANSTKIMDGVQ